MSLLSASHPTALSAACPSLPFPPGLHLSLALFLSSSWNQLPNKRAPDPSSSQGEDHTSDHVSYQGMTF